MNETLTPFLWRLADGGNNCGNAMWQRQLEVSVTNPSEPPGLVHFVKSHFVIFGHNLTFILFSIKNVIAAARHTFFFG
jgi:hypothetical protein